MISTLSIERGSSDRVQFLLVARATDTIRIPQQAPKVNTAVMNNVGVTSAFEEITPGHSTHASIPLHNIYGPKLRLKSNWFRTVAKAKALRENTPDPVQDLVSLFESLPGDYATWREIIEEPYG